MAKRLSPPVGPDQGSALPQTVVYLDHTAKWSGGEIALLRLLEALDPARVTPGVGGAAGGGGGAAAARVRCCVCWSRLPLPASRRLSRLPRRAGLPMPCASEVSKPTFCRFRS